MEIKKLSKEKLLNIANTVGNATKNTVTNIGEATKMQLLLLRKMLKMVANNLANDQNK